MFVVKDVQNIIVVGGFHFVYVWMLIFNIDCGLLVNFVNTFVVIDKIFLISADRNL